MTRLLLSLLLIVSMASVALAQCDELITLRAIKAVDNGGSVDLEFDVYIESVGPDFLLGDFDLAFTFDPASFSSPALQKLDISFVTMVPTETNPLFVDFFRNQYYNNLVPFNSPSALANGRAIVNYNSFYNSSQPDYTAARVSSTQTRIGRFRITNYQGPIGDASGADLEWQTPGMIGVVATGLACIDPNDPTGPANFDDNPMLIKDAALPIELTIFSGYHVDDKFNQLTWETASEVDFSHFELQHSVNGVDFQPISRVEGTGEFGASYEYAHENYRLGDNYYRLKAIDLDETYAYSEIINIPVGESGAYNIYPVPAKNDLTIEFISTYTGNTRIDFFDVAGKLVNSQTHATFEGFNKLELDIRGLAAGHYMIRVAEQGGTPLFTDKLSVH